ncbi:MAG: dodecin family protein [Flavobacteriaceae bacterium]|nr:dodecin family protein [Flavobacteriaceae bacterium]
MSVLKVIEIMANSPVSWEDATKNAVKHAGKSLKGIKSAHVQSQSVVVDKNNITEFRVNLKISFEVLD